jgi:L-threonylcarbamoyladenylate synthase
MLISLEEAAHLLKNGKVIGVPTETVYGLAASLGHPLAIQEIYKLKGRPSNNPLIIHVAQVSEIFSFLSEVTNELKLMAHAFWPGPMTLVLPVNATLIPSIARANLPTAAFRIPQHPLALQLLKLTGPLVMPSANLSGRPSSTQPFHVENDFGTHFPLLDGGICDKGLESTILIQQKGRWEIIRQGALAAESFKASLGYTPQIQAVHTDNPICPGQMYRHYAPKAKLMLLDSFEGISEGIVIGFNDRTYPLGCRVIALGDLTEPKVAAAKLYAVLRQLDQEGILNAYVDMKFDPVGILATLAERLRKAADN